MASAVGSRITSAVKTTSALLRRCRSSAVAASSQEGSAAPAAAPHRPDPADADTLMDIGTRRIFTEEHDMFRRSVRRFFQEEVRPRQAKFEEQGFADRDVWLAAGAQGLLGVQMPSQYGGADGTFIDASIIMDEQFYANETSLGFQIHSDVVAHYFLHYGSEEQKSRYLPPLCSGESIGCIGITEPGAGSDMQGIRTVATRDGDDYILNGSKTFITNGWHADVAVVVALTDPKARPAARGLSLFVVEKGTPGFSKGKPLQKMGYKGQDTCELFFDDVRLPKSALLGRENQGFVYLVTQLPQERHVVAVLAQAHAEFMFETTREYVKGRKAFGRTIADLQVTQHKLAELKTEICVSRAFVDQCTQALSEGTLDTEAASMGKYWASDMSKRVADACVQLHGGWGYMAEYDICRAFTAARLHPIYAGTNEIMKEIIARNIVKVKK